MMHRYYFHSLLQGKRIDNTSVRDDPYAFVLGTGQVRTTPRHTQHTMH